MPVIAAKPFVLKDAVLTIGTDEYQGHISSAQFVPSTSQITWQAITPSGAFSDQTSAIWSLTLEYAQDWETTNSLAQYLLTNAGQKKTMVFKPKGTTTGMPIFTADVMIAPGQIGGAVNTVQVGTVTLGVVGVPVKTAAP